MMYRKKPVKINAVTFEGKMTEVLKDFIGDAGKVVKGKLVIETPEGDMQASKGDYVIKGIKGEFYPCKPDIFRETYEPVAAGTSSLVISHIDGEDEV